MALSGSFSGSIVNENYKLRVDWSATQNVAKNTSKITCVMYLVQASSWSLGIGTRSDNSTTINGTKYTWSSPAISNGGGKTTKLATVTSGEITHNADGTKSVALSATFNIEATISGTYRGTITASTTVTLNTIPRATQHTLSSTSVNMGSAVTISMPRASSSFTHDLSYRLNGGSWVSIATGRGTSYSWTVPDLASSIPNAASGTITVRCITKNGSTTVGTKTANMTAKVPTSVIPTVGALAIQDATSGLATQFGAYIQGKSTLAVSIAASGAKGSTITAYSTTVAGKTYTGASFTTSVLTGSGSISLVTKVKDSRGRWSTAKTTTVTLLAYSAPKITKLTPFRVNAAGNADEEGEYLSLAYAYSVTSLGSKNTAAMTIEYKRTVDTTWATLTTGSALSANTTIKPTSPTFSTDSQYDIRLTVKDWFGASRTYTATLPTGSVILDLLASGKGIAFGKVAEAEGFDLGFPLVGLSTQSQAGQVELGGLLIQWGGVSITPSAANTPTTSVVTFPRAYTATPTVFVTPVSSVPESLSVAIQRAESVVGDPKVAVAVTLTRAGTTTTGINWLAIGPG